MTKKNTPSDLQNDITKEAISWEDAKNYAKNIYNKIFRKQPVDDFEEQLLQGFPQVLLDDAYREISEEVPWYEIDYRQELNKLKTEQEQALTPEQRQQLIQTSPEASVLNTFMPEVFDENVFYAVTSPMPDKIPPTHYVDASINSLAYLAALGYSVGTWVLGPEHNALGAKRPKDLCKPVIDGIPICDRLNGSGLDLRGLISQAIAHANTHGYYPPKPLIAQTHPGCRCSLICHAPATPEMIPDNAPGVPVFGTPEELLFHKQRIHKNLKDFQIDRWTILHPDTYSATTPQEGIVEEDIEEFTQPTTISETKASESTDRYKFAEWKEDIKPVKVKEGFIIRSSLGTYRPIPNTYYGLQTEQNGEYCKVFLGDISRIVTVPMKKIEEINIKSVNFSDADSNMFIKVDDTIGIIIKIYSEDKILAYFPDFNARLLVDSGEIFDKTWED
jgi:hypothetical protein